MLCNSPLIMIQFRLEHWDVNNENLHGDFYERHTGSPNITMQMFRDIHNVDRSVKLFLNDFGVIEGGNNNKATVVCFHLDFLMFDAYY